MFIECRWQLTYKTTFSARLPTCLAISSLGDFCVMGGASFISLWTIDALMDSYTKQIVFAPQPPQLPESEAIKDYSQVAPPGLHSDEAIEEMPSLTGEVC